MYNLEDLSRKRARKFFTVKKLGLPVEIEKIASEYAEIEEDFIPSDGDAVCINREGRPLIILKENVTNSRKRFTLAHELGHIQIPWHTGMLSCHTDDGEKINSSKYYQMEREANIFAAELLMPQSWLRNLVDMKADWDLKELIKIISEKAQVSFSAALYNMINVLPSGYVVFIENKKENYIQKKVSGNVVQPLFLNNEDYSTDYKWVLFNSYQNGEVEHEILNIYWFKYKTILEDKVVENCIKKLSEEYSLSNVLADIINTINFSIAFTLRLLTEYLPSGYILKISFLPSGTYSYLNSKETYIYPKGIRNEDINNWYNEYCQHSGVYKEKKIIINWWFFKTIFDFKINNDIQDSKLILRNIINNWYSESEKKSIFAMVNGIIGSLNNQRRDLEPEQFYSILRQKFLGDERLERVINHKEFNQFLVSKTLELYKK